MELHRVVEGSGPRVVLVHGFTQTLVSWRHVAARLAPDHEVVRVDAPGHGGSGDVEADLHHGAALLAESGGRGVYVGYSMGGRLALRLALDRPDLVDGLVLVGATAGIDDPDERADRRRADEAMAAQIETQGVESFLDGWLSLPLFAGLPPDPVERRARAANTADGLASSLRLAGTGTMDPPWWDELHRVSAPTIVLAGGLDHKFTDLGRRLVTAIGREARFLPVEGAGHAAHLHDPDLLAESVRALTRGITGGRASASPG